MRRLFYKSDYEAQREGRREYERYDGYRPRRNPYEEYAGSCDESRLHRAYDDGYESAKREDERRREEREAEERAEIRHQREMDEQRRYKEEQYWREEEERRSEEEPQELCEAIADADGETINAECGDR